MYRWASIVVLSAAMIGANGCSDDESSPRSPARDASGGTAGQGGSGGGSSGGTTGSAGTGGTAGSSAGSGGTGGAAGAAGASGSSGNDGGNDSGVPCTLTPSGPVVTQADGQVIEYLRIEADGQAAIDVNGHQNVVIRNVQIRHRNAPGITFSNADDLVIENVGVEHLGAPASGQNPSDVLNNIAGYQSARVQITNVRLRRGSSGIYLLECPDSRLRGIEGHDFRGPFPRGQLVQWDKSNGALLEDFSVVNPPGSWPEDNVNVYQSTGAQIRRGHIDGNNSPSGVGVIFDGGFSTGVVEDVDAIRMGNGCFSDYAGAADVVFRRTRCRENICSDQGRGVPLSNALMWSGNPDLTGLRIEDSTYYAACNPGNIVWPTSSFEVVEVDEADFSLRPALELAFCWE